MNYVIGIDGGGTKTDGVAYDLDGNKLAQVITGFGNLLIDFEEGLTNIKSAIETLLSDKDKSKCQLLVVGLAGIDSGGLKETLMTELAVYKVPTVIINDGQLAHAALLNGEDGVLVISGTGSLVIGLKDQRWFRVGGWGHFFGDEGSGYEIGKKAIQQVFFEADRELPASLLSLAVLEYFKVESVLKLAEAVYGKSKGELASLSQVVSGLSEKDPSAREILEEAGRQLADQVYIIAKRMTLLNNEVSLGLNGSVIERNEIVRKSFFSELKKRKLKIKIFQNENSSAIGAYYLYKKKEVK